MLKTEYGLFVSLRRMSYMYKCWLSLSLSMDVHEV